MAESKFQLGKFFQSVKEKTSSAVAQQEASFALGKVAGKPVYLDNGEMLVDVGIVITQEIVERAKLGGKLHALAGAAAAASAQDAKEKAQRYFDTTEEGRERSSLDSVDQFIEAQKFLGRQLVSSVTDIRGNVIVAEGAILYEDDIRRAREAGQLGALIAVARVSPRPQPKYAGESTQVRSDARMLTEPAGSEDDIPSAAIPLLPEDRAEDAPVRPRPSLPLMSPPEE